MPTLQLRPGPNLLQSLSWLQFGKHWRPESTITFMQVASSPHGPFTPQSSEQKVLFAQTFEEHWLASLQAVPTARGTAGQPQTEPRCPSIDLATLQTSRPPMEQGVDGQSE